MVKYLETIIGLREVPDEIALCINITQCRNNCEGCHSPQLRENIGKELTITELLRLVDENPGISCVCFMGEGNDPAGIIILNDLLKKERDIKTCWYIGRDLDIEDYRDAFFDYIKLGPYIASKGGLDHKTTNQQMWEIKGGGKIENITYKFWK